ncbi:GIY-YIG nuclease family protein [Caulobacter sp. 73W]|uniref:GIY-YIG nuclease family protein n=1 Tax=Caulobacter sp. 73W TaxID=3161137 RepID=A0AB39KVH8_9CAUL
MNNERRKALVQAYKEMPKRIGVFALRCEAGEKVWVGVSRNLDAQQNSLWFSLRLGSHTDRNLQACWKAEGEAAFRYEVLEVIDQEGLSPYELANALKDRVAAWRTDLAAFSLS